MHASVDAHVDTVSMCDLGNPVHARHWDACIGVDQKTEDAWLHKMSRYLSPAVDQGRHVSHAVCVTNDDAVKCFTIDVRVKTDDLHEWWFNKTESILASQS